MIVWCDFIITSVCTFDLVINLILWSNVIKLDSMEIVTADTRISISWRSQLTCILKLDPLVIVFCHQYWVWARSINFIDTLFLKNFNYVEINHEEYWRLDTNIPIQKISIIWHVCSNCIDLNVILLRFNYWKKIKNINRSIRFVSTTKASPIICAEQDSLIGFRKWHGLRLIYSFCSSQDHNALFSVCGSVHSSNGRTRHINQMDLTMVTLSEVAFSFQEHADWTDFNVMWWRICEWVQVLIIDTTHQSHFFCATERSVITITRTRNFSKIRL